MKQITGEEFVENIKKDPSWCLSVKEPIEITTYVQIVAGQITHLSPLLTFSGNKHGLAADFGNCEGLKVATGNFKGSVYFQYSGITTIKDLNIKIEETDIKANFLDIPITYVPKEYRTKEFLFDAKIIKESIKKDKIIRDAINKIKSEANNIII